MVIFLTFRHGVSVVILNTVQPHNHTVLHILLHSIMLLQANK